MNFLSDNWGSLLTGGFLILVVALIIWKLVRDKKRGKNCCGCEAGGACAGCAAGTADKEEKHA